jgi:hypothetical protein
MLGEWKATLLSTPISERKKFCHFNGATSSRGAVFASARNNAPKATPVAFPKVNIETTPCPGIA